MNKKIIAVNAGPRKGWNIDTMIKEAAKGAKSAGAAVENLPVAICNPVGSYAQGSQCSDPRGEPRITAERECKGCRVTAVA